MTPMLELMLADGRELDVPSGSIVMFEEMKEGKNPNFPNARSFIRYALGEDLRTAIVSTKVEDMIFDLGINTAAPGRWLRLTKKSGERIVLLVGNVVSRMAMAEGCEISYVVGRDTESVEVSESRREVKKWSEAGETGRPEGLVELPVPEENR
jgi:hypothetical protein